jgi:hypothetical protein
MENFDATKRAFGWWQQVLSENSHMRQQQRNR